MSNESKRSVAYSHSDGEVICANCHRDLGMDQAAECTPATSLQDLGTGCDVCGRSLSDDGLCREQWCPGRLDFEDIEREVQS